MLMLKLKLVLLAALMLCPMSWASAKTLTDAAAVGAAKGNATDAHFTQNPYHTPSKCEKFLTARADQVARWSLRREIIKRAAVITKADKKYKSAARALDAKKAAWQQIQWVDTYLASDLPAEQKRFFVKTLVAYIAPKISSTAYYDVVSHTALSHVAAGGYTNMLLQSLFVNKNNQAKKWFVTNEGVQFLAELITQKYYSDPQGPSAVRELLRVAFQHKDIHYTDTSMEIISSALTNITRPQIKGRTKADEVLDTLDVLADSPSVTAAFATASILNQTIDTLYELRVPQKEEAGPAPMELAVKTMANSPYLEKFLQDTVMSHLQEQTNNPATTKAKKERYKKLISYIDYLQDELSRHPEKMVVKNPPIVSWGEVSGSVSAETEQTEQSP